MSTLGHVEVMLTWLDVPGYLRSTWTLKHAAIADGWARWSVTLPSGSIYFVIFNFYPSSYHEDWQVNHYEVGQKGLDKKFWMAFTSQNPKAFSQTTV